MKIAFDIDDTLLIHVCENYEGIIIPTGESIPNFDLIQVLKWYKKNGDEIFFWSAGGQSYCKAMVSKIGLTNMGRIIEKEAGTGMDICFDDQDVQLATVNVKVSQTAI